MLLATYFWRTFQMFQAKCFKINFTNVLDLVVELVLKPNFEPIPESVTIAAKHLPSSPRDHHTRPAQRIITTGYYHLKLSSASLKDGVLNPNFR